MKLLRPADGPIPKLGHWNTPRPLGVTPPKYKHGGLDFTQAMGDPYHYPEGGAAYAFALFRQESRKDELWHDVLRIGDKTFPWVQYGYDVYGAVMVLKGDSGMVHLLCHSYFRAAYYSSAIPPEAWEVQEDAKDIPFPMMLWHTFATPHRVERGSPCCRVGSAGVSTGPHLHWEIHNGWEWTPHGARPDPEKLI